MSRVGSGTHTSTDRDASREETSAHALDLRHPEDDEKDLEDRRGGMEVRAVSAGEEVATCVDAGLGEEECAEALSRTNATSSSPRERRIPGHYPLISHPSLRALQACFRSLVLTSLRSKQIHSPRLQSLAEFICSRASR